MLRNALALVALAVVMNATPSPEPLRQVAIAPQTISSNSIRSGVDGAAEAEIRAALDLFARAGLALPELRIYVHSSTEPCGGWLGLFDSDGAGNRIDLCGDVLLHELAHAWEHHNMTDVTRQAFLAHANLDVWNDRATPHPARGIEHAANVIAWGVNSRPLDVGEGDLQAERLYRYELLTGRPSPRIAHLAAGPDEPSEPVASLEPTVEVLGSPAQRAAVEDSLASADAILGEIRGLRR